MISRYSNMLQIQRPLAVVIAVIVWFASAQSVAAQTTFLNLNSQTGDFIGQGTSRTLTPTDGNFTSSRNFDNGVTINFAGGASNSWSLDFAAPGDAQLTVGSYENAERFPFQSPTRPGLSVTGQGRGCNTLTGRFDVLLVEYGAGSTVTRFAASFEQHCEGAAPALFGAIVFNTAGTPQFTVTVIRQGSGSGTVTSSPTGIDCGNDCSEPYNIGSVVTLTATPIPGHSFNGWTGDADCSDGIVSRSVPVSCTATFLNVPPQVPGAPTNFAVNVSGATVIASWSPPTSGGSPIGYQLEVVYPTQITVITDVGNVGFRVLSLANGTYVARVRAYNATGSGLASPSVTFTVNATAAPTNFGASVNGSNVTFTWGPPSVGPVVSFYRIEIGVPGNELLATFDVTPGTSTNFTTTLANATYVARARAVSSGVVGAPTNDIQFVVGPVTGPVPFAPQDLRAEVEGRTVTLRWNHRGDSPPASSFVIQAGSALNRLDFGEIDTQTNARQITFFAVPNGTYFLRVRARNANGTSYTHSNVILVAIPQASGCLSPLDPPQNVGATVLGGSVFLTWSAPAVTGRPITSYRIQVGSGPGLVDLANFSTGTTLTAISGAVPRGTYYVRVLTEDVCGLSGPSNEIVVVVP